MTEPILSFRGVSKRYQVPLRAPGFAGTVQYLLSPRYKNIQAVDGLDFEIQPGDSVGYVGVNGAGKSTSIKLLLGILQPDQGSIQTLGCVPNPLRDEIKRRVGVVFGQRSQLWWNLPVRDSFNLLGRIYRVPADQLARRIADLAERLEVGRLLDQPARQLSLGQRMRCDLAAACLHEPELLVLDEPTIGLDVASRFRLRAFLKERNRTDGVTIFLTTHDMGDIEDVCARVLLIHGGRLLADDPLPALCRKLGNEMTLSLTLPKPLYAGQIGEMEETLAHVHDRLWSLETTSESTVVIRLPDVETLHAERIQRAFFERFAISSASMSDTLPLERILQRLGARLTTVGPLAEGLSPTELLHEARRLRLERPDGVAAALLRICDHLESREDRLAVLVLLRGLEGEPGREAVADALRSRLSRRDDPHLTATLVRLTALFAPKQDGELAVVIPELMRHDDPRVRANAVEAWSIQQGDAGLPELEGLLEDASPRVRTNVTLFVWHSTGLAALERFERMLADPAAAESAAFCLRRIFETRPVERRLAGDGDSISPGTMALLAALYRLEDVLVAKIMAGGELPQQILALAAFPYARGLGAVFEIVSKQPAGVPLAEITARLGVR